MSGLAALRNGNALRLRRLRLPALLIVAAVLPPGAVPAQAVPDPRIEPLALHQFDRSTTIDNKFLPMAPGTRWTYQGTTVEDDGKVVPHRIEITVTDLTKTIAGVRTVVSYDLDYSDGELVEAELALFAQDNDGNVWRVGEYPEEYEDGKLIRAPAWIHGVAEARAGIMMPADPQPGAPSYAQGFGPAVGWADRATTHQVGQQIEVPAGRFEDVLVIKETAPAEIDAAQLKYYAPGIGNIRVGWLGSGEKSKEVLELVAVERLGEPELAAVRAKALALEGNAYRTQNEAYRATAPSVAP